MPPLATLLPPAPDSPGAAACLALALAALLAFVRFRVRGTTLVAPATWAIAAALGIATVEGLLLWRAEWQGSLAASMAQYAAAVGTCCPLVAVLGAKRPQDRGWQWIVLSLWIVLLVPAGQAILSRMSGHFVLPWAWRSTVLLLIALGPLNYLPTRWGVTSLLVSYGQYTLLSPWLDPSTAPVTRSLAAMAIFYAAILVPLIFWRVVGVKTPATTLDEALTRRWLNFRNGWGAFWALRILQRVNESAAALNWPVRLHWTGFAPADAAATDAAIPPEVAAQIDQTLDTLLRRFERLTTPPPSPT
jgi:hypothetical protein